MSIGPQEEGSSTVSIVTPCLNGERFIRSAMESVLEQRCPSLEYIVVDGGSSDRSVEIIESFSDRLAWWTSEPDGGLYDALNKGFSHSAGSIMGYLNCDDLYSPWALDLVSEIFNHFPNVQWLTTMTPLFWDERGRAVKALCQKGVSANGFLAGESLADWSWYSTGWIQQESTFWRRSLWDQAGGHFDASLKYAGDFELWARFFEHSELLGVMAPIGGFRQHEGQLTSMHRPEYLDEALAVLQRFGRRPRGPASSILRRIHASLPPRLRGRIAKDRGYPYCFFDAAEGRWRLDRAS